MTLQLQWQKILWQHVEASAQQEVDKIEICGTGLCDQEAGEMQFEAINENV